LQQVGCHGKLATCCWDWTKI